MAEEEVEEAEEGEAAAVIEDDDEEEEDGRAESRVYGTLSMKLHLSESSTLYYCKKRPQLCQGYRFSRLTYIPEKREKLRPG